MFQKEKKIWFSIAFLLMVVLLNVLIIKTAYLYNHNFYWAMLFSLPVLSFETYYKRRVSKKEAKDTRVNGNDGGFHKAGNVTLLSTAKGSDLNLLFGNSQCAQPYLSSLIWVDSFNTESNATFSNIDIVSHNGNNLSKHFRKNIAGTDESKKEVIWKICPDYAGCVNHNLDFNPDLFRLNVSDPSVKMIELQLSQPMKWHPISAENRYKEAVLNTKYRSIVLNPIPEHKAFGNAESMTMFLDSLRQLSGKKPVGIRLCITDKKAFHEICYAIRKTEIIPDYIVIEDCSVENSLCTPFYDALLFASKALETCGLAKEVKVVAATTICKGLDVLKLVALGADAIIMQNHLPPDNNRKMINLSANAVSNDYCQLRNEILRSTIDLMNSFGHINIKEITLSSLLHKLNNLEPLNTDKDKEQFKYAGLGKPFKIIKDTYTDRKKVQLPLN